MGTLLLSLSVSAVLYITSAQDTGYFWHLTDLHYDPWYNSTYGVSCNEMQIDGGAYGDHECDSPWELVISSINAMKTLAPDPEFIIWTGDNPPHVYDSDLNDLVDTAMIIEITRNITVVIQDAFPNTLVLPMLGNHDYYPKNQLPGESNALYDAFAEMWNDWLDTTDMQNTFKRGGYYSLIISNTPLVRAIVINTNLYYSSNQATEGQDDPGGQIAWFEDLFENARQNGEKILFLSHVPFGKVPEPLIGKGWLVPSRNRYFQEMIVNNSDIILTTIAVHAHADAYKLLFNDDGEAVSTLFISPSVTPWKVPLSTGKTPPHNPAIRKFHFSTSTYELLDYEQYSLDLPEANGGRAEWRKLYQLLSYYGIDSMQATDLQTLLQEFNETDSTQFAKYYKALYVDTQADDSRSCGCDCKSSHLCAIAFVDYDEYDQCYEAALPACDDASGTTGAPELSFGCMTGFIMLKYWFI